MNHSSWRQIPFQQEVAAELSRQLNISSILAAILTQRGMTDPKLVREFLNPTPDQLHDPFLLPDMDEACVRILKALENKERMLVYGDYDADGVTSTALLIRTLSCLNADVRYRIPRREAEGYDLHLSDVERAHEEGVSLIITVDCGSHAVEPIQRANELGIDVVVTDHHPVEGPLPDAAAVVNPGREDSEYPFPFLSGVGVAFKLGQALSTRLNYPEDSFTNRFYDLTALGTVADHMPLIDENRVLVALGLKAFPSTKKIGLRALAGFPMQNSRIPETDFLGFQIAPKINAVGRLDDASKAVELLITRDENEARSLDNFLTQKNLERRRMQENTLQDARKMLSEKDFSKIRVIVLSSEDWHPGLIGAAAGKVAEEFHRPAVLISRHNGVGHGSCRSIEGFDIRKALEECADLLIQHGGHAQAAAFDIESSKVELFRERMHQIGFREIPEGNAAPSLAVNLEIPPDQIGLPLAQELQALSPLGYGNETPLFVTHNMTLVSKRTMGGGGAHLSLFLQGDKTPLIRCVGWGMGELCSELETGQRLDICYQLGINHYNGTDSVQLVLQDMRVSSL